MTAPDLVDRLAAHKLLGAAPREELAWLAAHGSLRRMVTWRGWGEAAGEPAYPRNENAVDGVEAPWG